jgi:plastocyanin
VLNQFALAPDNRRRRLAVLAAALLLTALVSACSSSKSSGGSTPTGGGSTPTVGASTSTGGGSTPPASGGGSTASGKDVNVEVKNFAFAPKTVTVSTGSKVTWKFDDSTAHNATANDKSFKSSDLSGGKTFSFTFNKAGTYDYMCTIHPFMKATVVVN